MDSNPFLHEVVDRVLMTSPMNSVPSLISDTIFQFAIPQLSTAFLSFVASTAMAIMIARTGPGLSVPYRRIIFGLSMADIFQSLGFLFGPISLPSSIPYSLGIGNDATCKTTGYLIYVGHLAVPMYTCFVCWYYLCKLKYRMSDDGFKHQSEKKIHALIILSVVIVSLTAVGLDIFHPVPARTFCSFAPTPFGCTFNDEVECDNTKKTLDRIFLTIRMSIHVVCIFGMIGMMAMIYMHAIIHSRIFQHRSSSNDRQDRTEIQEEILYLSTAYRNEIICQATCFVLAFILTYICNIIIHFMVIWAGKSPQKLFAIVALTLVPSGGFFNILVYTRPQTATLKRAFPNRSWLCCLWVVLRSGGEIPLLPFSEENTTPTTTNSNDVHYNNEQRQGGGENDDQREPHFSFSSNDPYGEERDDDTSSTEGQQQQQHHHRQHHHHRQQQNHNPRFSLRMGSLRTLTRGVSTDEDDLNARRTFSTSRSCVDSGTDTDTGTGTGTDEESSGNSMNTNTGRSTTPLDEELEGGGGLPSLFPIRE